MSNKTMPMECYCCRNDVLLTYHVKLRGDTSADWIGDSPESEVYKQYVKQSTYRSAFICRPCYDTLDNATGLAEVSGTIYNIAGESRGGKASVYTEEKYARFQRAQAKRMGLPEL